METPTIKAYIVTLRYQYPAWDEVNGISYEQEAKSKSQAIRFVRRQADGDGHLMRGKGRITFKAEETKP